MPFYGMYIRKINNFCIYILCLHAFNTYLLYCAAAFYTYTKVGLCSQCMVQVLYVLKSAIQQDLFPLCLRFLPYNSCKKEKFCSSRDFRMWMIFF